MEEQTRIKICGLTRLEDIDAVNELKPEYVGFVFAKSRRQITKEHAVTLRRYLDSEIQAVGVFVNELPAIVAGYLEEGVIDLAQLHGNESEEYIHSLRFRTGGELIKAFSIKTREDVEKAKKSSADYILLDHGKGGTGESFDWSLIRNMDRPYFLAGGLNAENVEQAMEPMFTTRPDLDTSLRRRHQQRCRDRRRKGPEKNHRMHKEDKTCLTEDLVFTEASTYRKL